MNYLAHAFLSNNNKDLLIGNFIADHIRGNQFENYSPGIVDGILFHRKIDLYTDTHAQFKACKRIFYNGFEKHSGILVDIYFDYFLAKDFEKYTDIPLAKFSENVYKVYRDSEKLLPESSSRFLEYVIKNNIYSSYATLTGIERVLNHLSNRIQHNVQLDKSIEILKANEQEIQKKFDVFFKELIVNFRK